MKCCSMTEKVMTARLLTRFVACADSPYRALHIGRSSVIHPSSMRILAMLLIVSLLARSSFLLLSFRSKP